MPNVMSCAAIAFRYARWFGVRPCRSARRVRSPAPGAADGSASASFAAAVACGFFFSSTRPSCTSSTDSGRALIVAKYSSAERAC